MVTERFDFSVNILIRSVVRTSELIADSDLVNLFTLVQPEMKYRDSDTFRADMAYCTQSL
jgi:hypothetical protein